MKLPKALWARSPVWEIGLIFSLLGFFYWRMRANATSFDDTELQTMWESVMFAAASTGVLEGFRVWRSRLNQTERDQ